MPIIITKYLL